MRTNAGGRWHRLKGALLQRFGGAERERGDVPGWLCLRRALLWRYRRALFITGLG